MSLDDERLRLALQQGKVDDALFDTLYPESIRQVSRRFWTPIAVARRAAELFESQRIRRILDVGSGPGKFCVAAAAASRGLCHTGDFTGIEQRAHLVESARGVAKRLGLANARFFVGDVTDVPWHEFDGLYFFNPFIENVFSIENQFDRTVELSERRFVADVRRAVSALARARPGVALVTYLQLGGPIPSSYELLYAERFAGRWLRLWVKRRARATDGAYYVESDEGVSLEHPAADTVAEAPSQPRATRQRERRGMTCDRLTYPSYSHPRTHV